MIIAGILRSMLRRWYVVLAGILLSASAAGAIWAVVPSSYERFASVLLLPGEGTLPEGMTNPYLYLGGLTTATDVLVGASSREVALADILAQVPDAEIMIGRDASTSAPVIAVRVAAANDADAVEAMNLVLAHIDSTLKDLQREEDVPTAERISLHELYVDDESTIGQRTRLMFAAAVSGGVVLLSVLLALMLDNVLRRRRTVRSTRSGTWLRPQADSMSTGEPGQSDALDSERVVELVSTDISRDEADADFERSDPAELRLTGRQEDRLGEGGPAQEPDDQRVGHGGGVDLERPEPSGLGAGR